MKIETYITKQEPYWTIKGAINTGSYYINVKTFITYDIPDNSTEEYISDFCKRKDVTLISK